MVTHAGNRSGAIFGLDTQPLGFDPHRWWNSATYTASANVFEQLVTTDPQTGELGPGLLRRVPSASQDGRVYELDLRSNVQFHHGRELTSDDVKFSLERLASPGLAAEAGALFTSLPIHGMDDFVNERAMGLAGIILVGRYELRIELDRPDRAFLAQLAYLSVAILPRDVVEKLGATFNWEPIGTGPYKLEEVAIDRGATLRRNPEYWGQVPRIETIRLEFNIEQSESVRRILDGAQDFMFEPLTAETAQALTTDPRLEKQIFVTDEGGCYALTLPMDDPRFSRPEVRRAVAMSVDKQKLVRLLKGFASEALGGLFPPSSEYFSDALAPALDVAGARAMLRDAGQSMGLGLDLLASNLNPEKEIAGSVKDDLAAVGVEVNTIESRYAEKDAMGGPTGPAAMTLMDWGLSVPHGSFLMDSAFTREALRCGCCNYSHFADARFDALARRGHEALTQVDEIAAYREMDHFVVADHVVWVPLVYSQRVDLVSHRVRDFTQTRFPGPLVKYFARYGLDEC